MHLWTRSRYIERRKWKPKFRVEAANSNSCIGWIHYYLLHIGRSEEIERERMCTMEKRGLSSCLCKARAQRPQTEGSSNLICISSRRKRRIFPFPRVGVPSLFRNHYEYAPRVRACSSASYRHFLPDWAWIRRMGKRKRRKYSKEQENYRGIMIIILDKTCLGWCSLLTIHSFIKSQAARSKIGMHAGS